MKRNCIILFCDNEHGTGDKTFPDLDSMNSEQIERAFIESLPVSVIRRAAKMEGWGRISGGDYCPACMESL